MINIIIGSDHGGFKLKEYLNDNLNSDYNVIDKGCYSDESIDYPDIAKEVCKELLNLIEILEKLGLKYPIRRINSMNNLIISKWHLIKISFNISSLNFGNGFVIWNGL